MGSENSESEDSTLLESEDSTCWNLRILIPILPCWNPIPRFLSRLDPIPRFLPHRDPRSQSLWDPTHPRAHAIWDPRFLIQILEKGPVRSEATFSERRCTA